MNGLPYNAAHCQRLLGAAALALAFASQPVAAQSSRPDGLTVVNAMDPQYMGWTLQHIRELQPTRAVYRGDGPVSPLESAPVDLADRGYAVSGGRRVTLDQWLEESATDAFLVLHEGKIIHETYRNGQQQHTPHQMWSVTKSFVGVLMLMLVEDGTVDPAGTMASYVPELEGSAFGDATVQQVLDMTTSLDFDEVYENPQSAFRRYAELIRMGTATCPGSGPQSLRELVASLQKTGDYGHGEAFKYVTPNTDALAWLLTRVTGQSLATLMAERLLQPLGVARDGYLWLDCAGIEMAGGGLSITARDAARFGQMLLQRGAWHGNQVVPAAVAERVLEPGDPATFTAWYDDAWYGEVGHSYHDQWWTFNNAHKAVSALGIHGQVIYIDPVAEMVVVKQSSHEEAEGDANEVDGPMIWQAIAERLLASAESR